MEAARALVSRAEEGMRGRQTRRRRRRPRQPRRRRRGTRIRATRSSASPSGRPWRPRERRRGARRRGRGGEKDVPLPRAPVPVVVMRRRSSSRGEIGEGDESDPFLFEDVTNAWIREGRELLLAFDVVDGLELGIHDARVNTELVDSGSELVADDALQRREAHLLGLEDAVLPLAVEPPLVDHRGRVTQVETRLRASSWKASRHEGRRWTCWCESMCVGRRPKSVRKRSNWRRSSARATDGSSKGTSRSASFVKLTWSPTARRGCSREATTAACDRRAVDHARTSTSRRPRLCASTIPRVMPRRVAEVVGVEDDVLRGQLESDVLDEAPADARRLEVLLGHRSGGPGRLRVVRLDGVDGREDLVHGPEGEQPLAHGEVVFEARALGDDGLAAWRDSMRRARRTSPTGGGRSGPWPPSTRRASGGRDPGSQTARARPPEGSRDPSRCLEQGLAVGGIVDVQEEVETQRGASPR